MKNKTQCALCGSTRWRRLPDPVNGSAATTAGIQLEEELAKSQCSDCGLVQRTDRPFLGLTDFYETKYASYYGRPGQEAFNASRYQAMASWLKMALGSFSPDSIIEVGCGKGWTLRALTQLYPHACIEGIEPSQDNSSSARTNGLTVHTAKVESADTGSRTFDVVFSNHVIQHSVDPVSFLKSCARLASPDGVVVITVQNSLIPQAELLYADQNYSFLPHHMVMLAKAAGLSLVALHLAPDTDELLFAQQAVFCRPDVAPTLSIPSTPVAIANNLSNDERDMLFSQRSEYLESWRRIDDFLCWKTAKYKRVFNFGAGLFSHLLACYCVNYWRKVNACVIDGHTGSFCGKAIVPFADLLLEKTDCLVVGTRPPIQAAIRSRLQKRNVENVTWECFVSF